VAKISDSYIYKEMMVSDLPNFIYCFGYTNASWTLKVDLTANYLCKILKYKDKHELEVLTPKVRKIENEENFSQLKFRLHQPLRKGSTKAGFQASMVCLPKLPYRHHDHSIRPYSGTGLTIFV
jgi:hypothetical protein